MNKFNALRWVWMLAAVLTFGPSLSRAQSPAACTGNEFLEEKYTITKVADVVYGNGQAYSFTGGTTPQDVTLDIWYPNNAGTDLRPLVILAHGGTFLTGSKESNEVVPICESLAKKGYVTVSINYRKGFNPFGTRNDLLSAVVRATQDGHAAVRYFYKSAATGNPYNIDTNKVFIGGSSAGGFLALHCAFLQTYPEFQIIADSSLPIGLGGIYGGNNGSPGYSSRVHGVINLCGAIGDLSWLTDQDIPVLSIHGTADDVVPYAAGQPSPGVPPTAGFTVYGSFLIDSALKAQGTFSSLLTFPGAGHTPYAGSSTSNIAYMDSTLGFITNKLYNVVCGFPSSVGNSFMDKPFAVTIAPNPAAGAFTLSWAAASVAEPVAVTLTDLQGRVVLQTTTDAQTGSLTLTRGDLPAGLYFLHAQMGSQTATQRVVLY